jgi:hypothetical protein
MPTKLHFKPSFNATAIYLAQETLFHSANIESDLLSGIRPAADSLRSCLIGLGISDEIAWLALLNASTHWDFNPDLAKSFLRKVHDGGANRPEIVARVAAEISELEAATRILFPELEKELTLRVGPLREQWEARGPGLLLRLLKTTDAELTPEEATVAIVPPIHGGGGRALLASNTVVFEGVLANADAQRPEVMRLAWLVSQLHLDLPKFSEAIAPARLPRVASLALLPPIFEAARYVDLIAIVPEMLRQEYAGAIRSWMPNETEPNALGEILSDWWDAQVEGQPPWRVALAALDRLIEAEGA